MKDLEDSTRVQSTKQISYLCWIAVIPQTVKNVFKYVLFHSKVFNFVIYFSCFIMSFFNVPFKISLYGKIAFTAN